MKKLLLLTAAVALAMGAQAVTVAGAHQLNAPMKRTGITLSQRASSEQATMGLKKAGRVALNEGETVISEPPAGNLFRNMYVYSDSYGLGWGDIYSQVVDGGIANIVEAEDGNLYVSGPISQAYVWALGSPYIKLTKNEDGTYTMATPQLYAIDAGDPYYIQRLKYDSEEETFVVDEDNTSVTFTWQDNVLTQVDQCYYGLTDADGSWFYMADGDVKMEVNQDEVLTVPEGLDEATMNMTYLSDASDLTVTATRSVSAWNFVDEDDDIDEIYFTYMETNLPQAAIKFETTQPGGGIIATRQYMGVDAEYNCHVYALTGNAFVETSGTSSYFNYEQNDGIALYVPDEEGDTLRADYPASIIINSGRNNLYIIEDYVAPAFVEIPNLPMTPADPSFYSVTERTSYDLIRFTIPTVDVEGNDLNTNYLSYMIYKDGEPYTFSPQLYEGFDEEMTVIPYTFADAAYDLYLTPSTGRHTLYFYDKDHKQVGLQSIYTGGGEEHRSNIVYYPVNAGVNDIDARTVGSVKYYNAAGQQVDENTRGFVIARTQYTDGTTSTSKVIR